MRRREFLKMWCGLAAALPLPAHGQQPKTAVIGVLLTGASNPDPEAFLKGLRLSLQDIGLAEGRNFRLDIQRGNSARGIRRARFRPGLDAA